jgi:uncharacterized protein (TIGR02594 family)
MPRISSIANFSNFTGVYCFGFNGIEMGAIAIDTWEAEFRILESRLGRWLSLDPEFERTYDKTPYHAMSDSPINRNDPLGNTDDKPNVNNPNDSGTLHSESVALRKHNAGIGDKIIVKSGDTLGKLAKQYNTTVQALAQFNDIANVNEISVGQTLVLAPPNYKKTIVDSTIPTNESQSCETEHSDTPWIDIAKSQLGVTEQTGNNDGPKVEEYLKTADCGSGNPWCGAFVNWTMKQVGIEGTNGPAWALNWRNFGIDLDRPAFGSVGTLKRPGGGHVGFVVANDKNRTGWVVMLGGNQGDCVSYRSFPIKIMQFNYPKGYQPSYSLPSMGNVKKGIKMN